VNSPEPPGLSPRPAARLGHVSLGIVSIFAGTMIGLLMVRGLLVPGSLKRDGWNIGGVFVFCLLATFLVWIGTRAVRRGRGQSVPKPTVSWGRTLGGVWLIFFALKSHFDPAPNSLKADNPGEAFGMLMATILMTVGGIMLIVSSLKALRSKLSQQIGA
jgi:hypothetical protein